MKIYDQFNRPVQKIERKLDGRFLATAPLTDGFRDYVADGLTPGGLAAVLKQADAGDLRRQAELFDQLEERDAHILGEISKRKNVILSAQFEVRPAGRSPRDIKIAEDVSMMFQNITDWEDVLLSMQDAVGKGFSAFELKWDTSEGQAAVSDFDFIEQKRFIFKDNSFNPSVIPKLITDKSPMGIDIPPFKMMIHRYGGKSGHPVRSGIYRTCAWWYLFKNYAVKDWVVFCEVYGMPLRLGKYDSGATPDDKKALEIAVSALGSDAAGIISKNTEIEFISGLNGAVSVDLYERLASFANKEMSKAIVGSTLTADSDGQGSYALGKVHNDVRLDLINADAKAIAATIRNQLIKPYVGFNYGWDTPVPQYTGQLKQEDLKGYANIIEKFADRMDIPADYIRKKYHIPAPKDGEETLRPKIGPISARLENGPCYIAGATNSSENRILDTTDLISGRIEDETDVYILAMLKAVKNIMADSGSLEEVREKLSGAFPKMDTADLGELIAQAMTTRHITTERCD